MSGDGGTERNNQEGKISIKPGRKREKKEFRLLKHEGKLGKEEDELCNSSRE